MTRDDAGPGFRGPAFPRRDDPIRFWARRAPDRIGLEVPSGGRRLSYRALDEAADRWAAWLLEEGVEAGDRVATLAGNRAEQVHLFHACGRIGAVLTPLNWRLASAELAGILEDADPVLLLGADRFREAAAGADAGAAWCGLGSVELPESPAGEPPAAVGSAADGAGRGDPEHPRLLLYTSGTTGRPKGVVLPRRQILYNAVATAAAWELGPADAAPVSSPLFHTGGWNVLATPLWHRGGRVVLLEGFDPDAFLGLLRETGCTVALTVPTQLRMLREGAEWGLELPELRTFFAGGEPLPASLARATREAGYPLRQGYGLTECGPNCFAVHPAVARERPEIVGRPVPFLEARLDAGGGEPPEPGEAGELQLRGPQMFGGYFRDPERTAGAVTDDGFLRTGDLARRHPDGAFEICGRRKTMFISGGENVFPAEVEAALAGHEAVEEAVVVGRPHPKWGEVGHAFVVPAARAADDAPAPDRSPDEASPGERGAPDPGALLARARERLAKYKVPRSVTFLEELPRLGSGKPDRAALKRRAREETKR